MFRFFSKIRYKLAAENRVAKYARYAIGEILLVVIGILIALQINNWNEDRKLQKKETVLLNQFLSSINNDLGITENFYDPRLERKKAGLDSLNLYVYDYKDIADSLFVVFYKRMSQDMYLRYDNGSFEALKSTGYDVIRNDSLRTLINKAYTTFLPMLVYFSKDVYDSNNPEISKLEPKILNLSPVLENDSSKRLSFTLKVDSVLRNQDFLRILNLEQQKYDEYTRRLEQMRSTLNALKEEIEKELNK